MTVAQADRRRDPYPFTWEIPVGVLAGWLLLACLGVHLARAIANATVGAGWTWPEGRNLFTSLPRILAGDPTAGLSLNHPAAGTVALYGWLITVQVLLLAVTVIATIWGLRRWGTGRMHGMASAAEAEQLLGISRLRRVAPIIRPDLAESVTTGGRHDGYHPPPDPRTPADRAVRPSAPEEEVWETVRPIHPNSRFQTVRPAAVPPLARHLDPPNPVKETRR